MVTIYYELVKVLVENSDAEQNYLYTNICGVDSWDNVGKLFDKKRMPTPSSMLQQDGISFVV